MKFIYTLVIISLFNLAAHSQETKKTEIYIIGCVHNSSEVLNPTMLFKILEDIKPDILLQENDSEQIKNYFKEIRPESNEQNATKLYLEKFPKTLNLPFEFEGRNEYRKKHGMVPTDHLTIQLLDSLYQAGILKAEEKKIWEKYKKANQELMAFLTKDFKSLNSDTFDSINSLRQNIQHRELPKITSARKEFKERFVTKPNGQRISYSEGYQLWCNFWDLRNNAMAMNIIKKANEHPGKRIVVLTGVQHKYYIKELLEKYYDGSYDVLDHFR